MRKGKIESERESERVRGSERERENKSKRENLRLGCPGFKWMVKLIKAKQSYISFSSSSPTSLLTLLATPRPSPSPKRTYSFVLYFRLSHVGSHTLPFCLKKFKPFSSFFGLIHCIVVLFLVLEILNLSLELDGNRWPIKLYDKGS